MDVQMQEIKDGKEVTGILIAYSDGTITKYKKGLAQVWDNPWEEPTRLSLEPCNVTNEEIMKLAHALNIAVREAMRLSILDELKERIEKDGGTFGF